MSVRRSRALELAGEAAEHLETIRRRLRDSISAEVRRLADQLTSPQLLALELLVDEQRRAGAGLSLSDLSNRLGLSHSTSPASSTGSRNALAAAHDSAQDRRYTQIELTTQVEHWLENNLPASRLQPLADALARASKAERAAVIEGLATLARLLEDDRRDTAPRQTRSSSLRRSSTH